jgi:hypothetical protein
MPSPLPQKTARIYPFPGPTRRSQASGFHDPVTLDARGPGRIAKPAPDWNAWYHEAAMRDEETSRKQ